MRVVRATLWAVMVALLLASATAAPAAWAQAKADAPGAVIQPHHRKIAGCVTGRGTLRVLLRFILDGDAKVKRLEIESESPIGKKARKCITEEVKSLQFGAGMAGQVIEHEIVVVNSGTKAGRR